MLLVTPKTIWSILEEKLKQTSIAKKGSFGHLQDFFLFSSKQECELDKPRKN